MHEETPQAKRMREMYEERQRVQAAERVVTTEASRLARERNIVATKARLAAEALKPAPFRDWNTPFASGATYDTAEAAG